MNTRIRNRIPEEVAAGLVFRGRAEELIRLCCNFHLRDVQTPCFKNRECGGDCGFFESFSLIDYNNPKSRLVYGPKISGANASPKLQRERRVYTEAEISI